MTLTLQQLEAHLLGAAKILRGKTAGQDYKNYILSLMFYKRLCDQWECEADDAIAEQERQQGRAFSETEKAVFRKRGEHRFRIPDGSRWGDVKAVSTNLGEVLTKAMRAVADANDELRGVFTVDWNQPAPDGPGKPVIPNEVVHALVHHFDEHDLSNRSVPPDVLGRAYEYLIKHFADDAGAKAGEFFTPPFRAERARRGAARPRRAQQTRPSRHGPGRPVVRADPEEPAGGYRSERSGRNRPHLSRAHARNAAEKRRGRRTLRSLPARVPRPATGQPSLRGRHSCVEGPKEGRPRARGRRSPRAPTYIPSPSYNTRPSALRELPHRASKIRRLSRNLTAFLASSPFSTCWLELRR